MEYTPLVDISELIKHEEVMSEYGLGPNGALVYLFLIAQDRYNYTSVFKLSTQIHY